VLSAHSKTRFHEQALLDDGRSISTQQPHAPTGAKHLQGVKAVVCSQIETRPPLDRNVFLRGYGANAECEFWIPNRSPPDSGARIEGEYTHRLQATEPVAAPCGKEVCAKKPVEALPGIAVAQIGRVVRENRRNGSARSKSTKYGTLVFASMMTLPYFTSSSCNLLGDRKQGLARARDCFAS